MDTNQLQNELCQFTGTTAYHRFSRLFHTFVLTDGTQFLAENAGAYWLMDLIASHFSAYRDQEFVAVKLKRNTKGGCTVRLEDGNDGLLAQQRVKYTDFPFEEITLYVVPKNELRVILLPSEY
jgi:hypothetical protein